MPQLNVCPDVAQFNRLAAGELSSADKETLLEHLEGCDACARRLDTLRGQETLLELLREGKSHGEGPPGEEVKRLVERLSKLKPMATPGAASPADIIFRCECGKNLKVKADAAGKKVKCPHCQKTSVVAPSQPLVAVSQTMPLSQPAPAQREAAPARSETITLGTKSSGSGDADTIAPEQNRDPELTEFLAAPQAPDELGRLGPYRILKILGAGGMGVVYKAEDPQLKRLVAIKAMLPGLGASTSAKKRFLREAQSAAAIKHDHIVNIYQVGEDRGVPFLAMEFLLGESLDDRLKREKKLPAAEVLRIGVEMAEGLAAAHDVGLIHRDIKPANVWLEGKKARVKILDFGLARATDEQQHLTHSGAIVGTPAYMSPEQAQGKPVDPRCDLFSLGVVLYRLCTGQQPFHGADTVSTLVAVSTQEPAAPAKLNADVPAGLSDLVMKLLEKDPAQRLGSAEEVGQALTKLQQHPPVAAAVPLATPVPRARTNPDTVLFETAQIAPVRPTPAPRKIKPASLAAIAVAAVVALSLCALIAGGVIVYRLIFPTGGGELVVETEGNAKVAFEKGKLLIYDPDGKNLLYTLSVHDKSKNLPLGKYKIKIVDANDVELNADAFEMTKKGWKVRVRLALNNAVAKKGPNHGPLSEKFTNDLGMVFVKVPSGKSWLGGGGGRPGDRPVEIKDEFYLGAYVVTQEEWEKVMGPGTNPSFFSRNGEGKDEVRGISDADLKHFPVEYVSWNDCQRFVAKLNEKTKGKPNESGWFYRLPTEVEWEYACRGGPMNDRAASAFDFYFDKPMNELSSKQANFEDGAGLKRPCTVGSYPSNRLGLYDMHGNVWEWCADGDEERHADGVTRRALRSGSFGHDFDICRAAHRHPYPPSTRFNDFGLRVARIALAAAETKPPSVVAEEGVRDFVEIHDADEARFDAWIAQMQKDSFRPVSLSIQIVKDAPRYTAVAVKEEKKRLWEFTRSLFGTELPDYQEMWEKNYRATIQNPFTHGDKRRVAVVWVWNTPLPAYMWTGDKPFIDEKIDQVSADKVRPLYRSASDQGNRIAYSVILGPDDGIPTDDVIDLSLSECKALIEKRKADGWRPKHLYSYGGGAKLLFGVTLVREKDRPEWDISWSLTTAAYEAELISRKSQGFRPHTAVGHDAASAAQRFSVIWIRYRPADAPAPTVPSAKQTAEPGVHDYAEIHDADEPRFDAWIAQMRKDGFRPVRFTVQTVQNAPRYTAVALKDSKNWPWDFSRANMGEDGHADKYWKNKFEAVAHALFRDKGKSREAFLWAKDESLDNDVYWFGDAGFIEDKIKIARRNKSHLISRSAVFEGNNAVFGIVTEEADGVPWQESYNLAFDDLKSYCEKQAAKGWRPDHFCYYGVGAKRLFGAIVIKDASKADWEVSWSLTTVDYEKELNARKTQGFRPLTAVGHEDNTGGQRFSVIWIRYRASIGKEENAPPPPGAKTSAKPPAFRHKMGMEFALVPKGQAWLGGGGGKEGNQLVTFDNDFYLGVYEVTQEEWKNVLGIKHPFHFSRQGEGKGMLDGITDAELKRFPVENVSWNECQLFLKKLNELDKQPGWEYRLPTEAEWEYACRGGPGDKFTSAFDFYLQEPTNVLLTAQANFEHDQGFKRTRQVGSYPPNKLGLYDMHGNVAELTHDPQPEKDGAGNFKRHERGGGWTNNADECKATGHYAWAPTDRFRDVGLRVVRVRVAGKK